MSHTPGPWFVDPECFGDIQAAGTEIASAFRRENVGAEWTIQGPITVDAETCAANARLIAAAPELLEVLNDILGDVGTEGYWWGEKALAVKAKAEGKQ